MTSSWTYSRRSASRVRSFGAAGVPVVFVRCCRCRRRAVMARLMPNVISPTPWHACMARPAAPVLGPHSPPKMRSKPPNSKMRRTMIQTRLESLALRPSRLPRASSIGPWTSSAPSRLWGFTKGTMLEGMAMRAPSKGAKTCREPGGRRENAVYCSVTPRRQRR